MGAIISTLVVFATTYAVQRIHNLPSSKRKGWLLCILWHDVRFTLVVSWRLFWKPRSRIPVLYEELQRIPSQVPCIFTRRGRIYFIKDGSLVPEVTLNKAAFEKMETSRKTSLGRFMGKAMTASGDHPQRWREAKKTLRPIVASGSITAVIPSISDATSSAASMWSSQERPVKLYKEALKVTLVASFQTLFGSDIRDFLEGKDLDEFVSEVDLVVNTTVTAVEEVPESFYSLPRRLTHKGLMRSTEGTFCHRIWELSQDKLHPEFTLDVALHNMTFYTVALPTMTSIVLHWTVLTLIRHPEHIERIREGLENDDRTYLRMCLKEVLRLYPPGSAYMVRRSKGDVALGDTLIKRRSLVVMLPVLLVDDQQFKPSRWKNNSNLSAASFDKALPFYAPFSAGARACLGRHLAIPLFEEMLVNLILNFDFELAQEDPWKGMPTALQHVPDNSIGFKPAKDLLFLVKQRRK